MTKRDRMMLMAVLAVVLLGGFWFLVITPQRKAAAETETQLATAQTELSAAQSKLTSGKTAREAFQRDRTTVIKLGRVVPESDDIPTLLTQLEALAKREDVKFTKYAIDAAGGASADATPAATTPPAEKGTSSTDAVAPLYAPGSVETTGGLARTPIAITLSGRYFNLERYLRAVQRFAILSAKRTTANGRLIIVDGFSYTPDPDETDCDCKAKKEKSKSPNLTATLSASVYFAPPLETPKASGAAAGTAPAAPADATSTSTGTATVGALR